MNIYISKNVEKQLIFALTILGFVTFAIPSAYFATFEILSALNILVQVWYFGIALFMAGGCSLLAVSVMRLTHKLHHYICNKRT